MKTVKPGHSTTTSQLPGALIDLSPMPDQLADREAFTADLADDDRDTQAGMVPRSAIPHLLSRADVAAIFGRSSRTISRWERRGYLTSVRIGPARFFRSEDIRRLIFGQLEAVVAGATKSCQDDMA